MHVWISYQPCKKRADPSETPESKHVEKSETKFTAVICEEETERLKWCCGTDIKYKPG